MLLSGQIASVEQITRYFPHEHCTPAGVDPKFCICNERARGPPVRDSGTHAVVLGACQSENVVLGLMFSVHQTFG